METVILDHPLVSAKLTLLRDKNTDSLIFRHLVEELVTLLSYEATRNLNIVEKIVETPITKTKGYEIADPKPLVVPILRAGLGMLDGMMRILPAAEVGFLGIVRNEKTLQPSTYAERIPGEIKNRQVFVLDPMLATGGTLVAAIKLLIERGAKDVVAICLLAAPEGIKKLEESFGNSVNIKVVCAGLDEKLNEVGYIVPGLGDAGDRLFGTAD
ncbi:MAG: uracil phosphoribosyltransferase [Candidatus Nanopelagicales bacterium]|jgi:uracil phosphoribosyltransferase